MFEFLYNLLFPKAWVADSSGNDHYRELNEIRHKRMTCLPFAWKVKTDLIRNTNAETYSILHKNQKNLVKIHQNSVRLNKNASEYATLVHSLSKKVAE
jgi:hypothetical protein